MSYILGYNVAYLSLLIVLIIVDILMGYGFGVCPMLNYYLYVGPENIIFESVQ